MPTVFSKPVRTEAEAEGYQLSDRKHPSVAHREDKAVSKSLLNIPSHEASQTSQSALEQHNTKGDGAALQQVATATQATDEQKKAALDVQLCRSDCLDRPEPKPSEHEITGLGEATTEQLRRLLTQPQTPRRQTDREAGLEVQNGQMSMEIHDWQTRGPRFILRNNPDGNPKGDLEAVFRGVEFVRVDFKMPLDYPGGMSGFTEALQGVFAAQRQIGILSMETGSEVVNQEFKSSQKSNHNIKWTNPWNNYGCRVNWMKAKAKSNTLKFKFVATKNVSLEEQVIITIDERAEFYKNLSHGDPVSEIKHHASVE
jgi:hypothetical protein